MIQGWAAIVAPILNKTARPTTKFWQTPSFINLLSLPPLLLLAILTPVAILSNHHYNRAFYAYKDLRAILGAGVDLGGIEGLGRVVQEESGKAILALGWVWIIWAIFVAGQSSPLPPTLNSTDERTNSDVTPLHYSSLNPFPRSLKRNDLTF